MLKLTGESSARWLECTFLDNDNCQTTSCLLQLHGQTCEEVCELLNFWSA